MKQNYIYLACCIMLLTACENFFESTVEIELPEHEAILALSSSFEQNDSVAFATLTITQSLNETAIAPTIDDASIQLFEDDQLLYELNYIPGTGNDQSAEDLAVYSAFVTQPFKTHPVVYTLKATHPVYGAVEAKESILPAPEVSSIIFSDDEFIDDEGDKIDELEIRISDDPDVNNFYLIRLTYFEPDFIDSWVYLDAFDSRLKEVNGDIILEDRILDTQESIFVYPEIYSREPGDLPNDSLQIDLISLNESAYRYILNTSAAEDAEGNPFAEPVFITSNVENGTGIFSMYSQKIFKVAFE